MDGAADVASRSLLLRCQNRDYRVDVADDGRVQIDGRTVETEVRADATVRAGSTTAWTAVDGDTRWVFLDGQTFEFAVQRPGARVRGGAHHGSLAAPMPATVRRIAVAPGQRVAKGDTLIVLEAMKMELPVRAGADGTVEEICCKEGELVQPGVTLIEMEES